MSAARGVLSCAGLPGLAALLWHAARVPADARPEVARYAALAVAAGVSWCALRWPRRAAHAVPARLAFALVTAATFWSAVLEAWLLGAGVVLALGFLAVAAGALCHATLVFALARGRGASTPAGRVLTRLLCCASALVLALCGVEGALAAVFPRQVYEVVPDDPALGRYLRFRGAQASHAGLSGAVSMPYLQPGFRGRYMHPEFPGLRVAIDALGMRCDPEAAAAPEDGSASVLVLGDSFAFGTGVEYAETFAARLAQSRVASARPWRVRDAGVPGVSPPLELVRLREVAEETRPDAVIVAFCESNDFAEILALEFRLRAQAERGGGAAVKRKAEARARAGSVPLRVGGMTVLGGYLAATTRYPYWQGSSAAARVFEVWFEKAFVALGLIAPTGVLWDKVLTESFRKEPTELVGKALDHAVIALQELRAACDEIRAAPVVLVIPAAAQAEPARFAELLSFHPRAEWPGLHRTAFHERFVAAVAAAGLRVVDPLPALEDAARTGRPSYHREGHWNARGHAIAAGALVPVLEAALKGN
jgi:hypothetical protein